METIRLEREEGVAWITLNRPNVRNALSLEMIDELSGLLLRLRDDREVKVAVVTGAGSTFVSGGDLKQFLSVRGRAALPLLSRAGHLLDLIETFPKPVIAEINGPAIGGGCELAAACHFRFASEEAVFGFVQIGMHITTGWGGGTRLLDKLPVSRALALLLTGERISARESERLGFVDAVYPAGELREHVRAFARKIAAQPLAGIEAYMRLLAWKRQGVPYQERIQREIEQCAGMWGSDEHLAAASRFLGRDGPASC